MLFVFGVLCYSFFVGTAQNSQQLQTNKKKRHEKNHTKKDMKNEARNSLEQPTARKRNNNTLQPIQKEYNTMKIQCNIM